MYIVRYAFVSHKGKVRKINQDNIICGDIYIKLGKEIRRPRAKKGIIDKQRLFGVFDGMGGEQDGEMASYIAARNASEWQQRLDRQALNELCLRINRRICGYSEENKLTACGTTAAMLVLDKNGSVGCNVGDSRVYHFRDGYITQLSEDHSLPTYQNKKAPLLQYLGIPETEMAIEPTFFEQQLRPGDVYLLCSDGLSDMVSEKEIQNIIEENKKVKKKAIHLLNSALKAGGRDNITFILISIEND